MSFNKIFYWTKGLRAFDWTKNAIRDRGYCTHITRDSTKIVETIKLNDGYEMPVLGLGTMFVSTTVIGKCIRKCGNENF